MNAIADQKVNTMHTNATVFEIDRITATPPVALFESISKQDTKAMRVHYPATPDPDEGSSPRVTTGLPTAHPSDRTPPSVLNKQTVDVLLNWRVGLVLHRLVTVHLRGYGWKPEFRPSMPTFPSQRAYTSIVRASCAPTPALDT
jgi:hypothetical protein